jgi:type II secretory pathway pseudopilin PulG
LIVVITILAILWTIAIISFKGYTSQTRDSKTIHDLSTLHTWISLYKAENWLAPMPDNAETVTAGSTKITFEGIIWDNLKRLIKVDRKAKNYEYATNGSQKLHVLIWELENTAFSHTTAYAEGNNKIFKWDEILVLYNSENKFTSGDIENLWSSNFKAYLGEKELEIANNKVKNVPAEIKKNAPKITYSCEWNLVVWNANITNNSELQAKISYQNSDSNAPCYYSCKSWFTGANCETQKFASCKAILASGKASGDWNYDIWLGENKENVYCDMTNWWWTLVSKMWYNKTYNTWELSWLYWKNKDNLSIPWLDSTTFSSIWISKLNFNPTVTRLEFYAKSETDWRDKQAIFYKTTTLNNLKTWFTIWAIEPDSTKICTNVWLTDNCTTKPFDHNYQSQDGSHITNKTLMLWGASLNKHWYLNLHFFKDFHIGSISSAWLCSSTWNDDWNKRPDTYADGHWWNWLRVYVK